MRFDRARSWFPAQQEGPSRFLQQAIVIPETRGVDSFKDITPRMGAAIDVFGDGRTAFRVNFGKYLEGAGVSGSYANTNPTLRMPQTTSAFGTPGVTRTWIDANTNFVADCDLRNPNAQDLRDSGGDLCGVVSNTSFGQNILSNAFDPAILNGWGIRPSDWSLGVSIEQQISARGSVSVTYSRRSFHQFTVVDNLSLAPSDLTPFSVVAPVDPRLPDGGGYVVSGLYDVVPDKAGQVSNFVTDSANYGKWSQSFNGIDVTVNVHAARFTLAGGTSTGQTVADDCNIRARLPELATTTMGTVTFSAGLNTRQSRRSVRMSRRIRDPHAGERVVVVPCFQRSISRLRRPFRASRARCWPPIMSCRTRSWRRLLDRNLSANAPNVTVNLVAPGSLYGDRVNELDFRCASSLRFGGTRSTVASSSTTRSTRARCCPTIQLHSQW